MKDPTLSALADQPSAASRPSNNPKTPPQITVLALSATSDQCAVHGARRLGEDRAMMWRRDSHGATAKETWGRLARGIPLIPLNPGESRLAIKWWLARLAGSPMPSHRHARTCSGHPRVFQGPAGLAEGDARNESGHVGGVVRAGETEGLMDARIPGTSPGKPGHDVGKSTRAGRDAETSGGRLGVSRMGCCPAESHLSHLIPANPASELVFRGIPFPSRGATLLDPAIPSRRHARTRSGHPRPSVAPGRWRWPGTRIPGTSPGMSGQVRA